MIGESLQPCTQKFFLFLLNNFLVFAIFWCLNFFFFDQQLQQKEKLDVHTQKKKRGRWLLFSQTSGSEEECHNGSESSHVFDKDVVKQII